MENTSIALARLVFLLIYFGQIIFIEGDPSEFRLFKDLMQGYNPLERPVRNNSLPVKVTLDVVLQQIVGVDEKNQIIEVNVWLKYEWKDYKLKWEPREYGGINDVRFPTGKIWKPDVLLYNSADPNFDSTFPSNQVVYSDGTVNWIPPGILKSSCKIDITWFPFDDQQCYLKFGSWTYNGYALDLQPAGSKMDTSEYLENGEWLILSTPVNRSEKFYDCCPEPYPDLKFYMNIRRRTLYYGFNLIIPSLLISLMTILGFTLPPDAGEKITLEITILLSVCFFLSIVADMSPPTSEAVPLIGTFFTCCMLVVSASVVFTVVVLNLHYRTPDTHEMSPFVRAVLLNWLPWLLMMRRPGHKFSKRSLMEAFNKTSETDSDQMPSPVKPDSESFMQHVRSLEDGANHNLETHASSPPSKSASPKRPKEPVGTENVETRINNCIQPLLSNPAFAATGVHAVLLMMQRIHSELKFITKRMEQEDENDVAINDWKFAAMVVDRLCLFVFSAFIVASTCGIMFSAPHLVA